MEHNTLTEATIDYFTAGATVVVGGATFFVVLKAVEFLGALF